MSTAGTRFPRAPRRRAMERLVAWASAHATTPGLRVRLESLTYCSDSQAPRAVVPILAVRIALRVRFKGFSRLYGGCIRMLARRSMALLLALPFASPVVVRADDVRYYEENGVTYRETK